MLTASSSAARPFDVYGSEGRSGCRSKAFWTGLDVDMVDTQQSRLVWLSPGPRHPVIDSSTGYTVSSTEVYRSRNELIVNRTNNDCWVSGKSSRLLTLLSFRNRAEQALMSRPVVRKTICFTQRAIKSW